MRLLFEALPIFLAMFALILSFRRALMTDKGQVRVACLLGALCSVLLLIAQTSWAWSVSQGDLTGTDLANCVWTIYNSVVMAAICYTTARAFK